MTRRARAEKPTVPAPTPTLEQAGAEMRARQTTIPIGSRCGYCSTLDASGIPAPRPLPHRRCTWDRCACSCRNNAQTMLVSGDATPGEVTAIMPSLVDFL